MKEGGVLDENHLEIPRPLALFEIAIVFLVYS